MKACPFCAEEIQDAAIVCKHCGRDLAGGGTSTAVAAPPAKKSMGAGTIALIIVGGLFFFGWLVSTLSPPASSSGAATSTGRPSDVRLALLSSNGSQSASGSYWNVEGEVKNISDAPIKGVLAVASWYSDDGKFIRSDDAVIEFSPIMPGQTSPFKTISSGNPLMSKYKIAFTTIAGSPIQTRDDRKE